MRITSLPPGLRVAFLGPAERTLNALTHCDWAETRFFCLGDERSAVELAAVRQWAPDVCLLFGPERWTPGELRQLPGLKIGLAVSTHLSGADFERLRSLCSSEGGLRWVTACEPEPSAAWTGLPLLQTLVLPLDLSRWSQPLELTRWEVLVPSTPPLPAAELAALQLGARVTVLPPALSGEALPAAMGRGGILVYPARGELDGDHPLPLCALARGLLLITSGHFPAEWGIEPSDEYLQHPLEALHHGVADALRFASSYQAVRVRAWQKARELFDASAVYQRLIHDAFLFLDPAAHLAALAWRGAAATDRSAGE